MLHIFKHISIGPSFFCYHWTCLSAREQFWAKIEWNWMRFNALECTWVHLTAGEEVINVIECDWTCLSSRECLWVSLNVTECIFIMIPTCKWVRWIAFEECGHDWTCLSVDEHLWASIVFNYMQLNAIECAWVHVIAFEWVLNSIECDCTCSSERECLRVSMEPTWMHTSSWGNTRGKFIVPAQIECENQPTVKSGS